MSKYNVQYFDIEKGAPSVTIAEYGISLNMAATKMIADWKYGKIGYDRNKKVVLIVPHNNDYDITGSFNIKEKVGNKNYLRINSRDLARVISQYCGVSLTPSFRCMAEWDEDEKLLVIDPSKVLEINKSEN
ncbi:MAG: hypothetical protein ACOX3L_04220 [Lutisporaceae bacterium]|nr:hypothetical protein [Clostridiales bacterium]